MADSSRRKSSRSSAAAVGTHDRPLQAEDEYIRSLRRSQQHQQSSSSLRQRRASSSNTTNTANGTNSSSVVSAASGTGSSSASLLIPSSNRQQRQPPQLAATVRTIEVEGVEYQIASSHSRGSSRRSSATPSSGSIRYQQQDQPASGLSSSRELRTQRLRQERRSSSTMTHTPSKLQQSNEEPVTSPVALVDQQQVTSKIEPVVIVEDPVISRTTTTTPPPSLNNNSWSTVGRRSLRTQQEQFATTGSLNPSLNPQVNQYLAQRSNINNTQLVAARPSYDGTRSISAPTSGNSLLTDSTYHNNDDDSDESSLSSIASIETATTIPSDDQQQPSWSIRVSVLSAVDLPTHLVPSIQPMSPIVNLALCHCDDNKVLRYATTTGTAILSHRDEGAISFHEEWRFDQIQNPHNLCVVVTLLARAVMTPRNKNESPHQLQQATTTRSAATGSIPRTPTASSAGGLGHLFRRGPAKAEMEQATAAAAVANVLVKGSAGIQQTTVANNNNNNNNKLTSEVNVKLRSRRRRRLAKRTEHLVLGTQRIALSKLPLNKAGRMEQWIELDSSNNNTLQQQQQQAPTDKKRRKPSLLIEISVSSAQALDDSEDDMDEDTVTVEGQLRASFAKRASIKVRNQLKEEGLALDVPEEEHEPELEPGVIDFVCVVGAKDIGEQKADDGSSGWVNTEPECTILEQFPASDEFHTSRGRIASLPGMVEWFCFPDGCRLWRGATPPNLDELNLTRFSASSPANIATSIASFDACLGCTTSFSWFVLSTNADKYGSENIKTYGTVIRFFAPAPRGIDPTQDDFAQHKYRATLDESSDIPEGKRLWVPMAVCLTSRLAIVGTMEVMLLRLCEALADFGIPNGDGTTSSSLSSFVHQEVASLIVSLQRPIPGVVHCSIPFLGGDRFHIALPPPGGLPALPHGNSVASVCRLLGPDGIQFLLAAFLTECKILMHSDDIANLCLVAEVMSALIYPFRWALPYVPVLPLQMMGLIEAPLSFIVGVPTTNMQYIDPYLLEDLVVVDLDKDFSTSDYFESRPDKPKSRTPTPLPATVASNVSKAVHRLLRAEEEVEDENVAILQPGERSFPRMAAESPAEREFRVAIAMEVSGLLRSFQDCLIYASSSQPVFNSDRFLQVAPALFEEQRGTSSGQSSQEVVSRHVISPRSRRFMSLLVNCQHFHQFLDDLQSKQSAFFHEVMAAVSTNNIGRMVSKRSGHVLSLDFHKTIESLCSYLQQLEDKVPTYRVQRPFGENDEDVAKPAFQIEYGNRWPLDLLQQIAALNVSRDSADSNDPTCDTGVKHVSLEYLVELEKTPWRYQNLFEIPEEHLLKPPFDTCCEKVKLRNAIGERRYTAWKLALEQQRFDLDDSTYEDDTVEQTSGFGLDVSSILTSATDDLTTFSSEHSESSESLLCDNGLTPAQKRVADAKDRDILRRCLEKALSPTGSTPDASGKDYEAASENALRNPSARRFLLSVLNKMTCQPTSADPKDKHRTTSSSSSKLESAAFDVILRLGCSLLDSCMEFKDYDSAYLMLKLTAGIYTITGGDDDVAVSYMTGRLGLHPIYADMGVWERAKELHLSARQVVKVTDSSVQDVLPTDGNDPEEDEYENAVATLYDMLGYGIPSEELARFASRVRESNGWFISERGQSLMLLARRLTVRREQGVGAAPEKKSDLELIKPMSPKKASQFTETMSETSNSGDRVRRRSLSVAAANRLGDKQMWSEIGWCHPAAQSTRRLTTGEKTRRTGATANLLNMLDEQKMSPDKGRQNSKHMKRAAITSMTCIGSSVVVTGGLDGGVFMVRKSKPDTFDPVSPSGMDSSGICGVHLDWGSSGSRYNVGAASNALDGEYGVGAVTCLASTCGSNPMYNSLATKIDSPKKKDVSDWITEEDILDAMEGRRVVAGTTCGDLRVWSIKDVFSAVFYSSREHELPVGGGIPHEARRFHGSGASSKFVSKNKGATDFAAGSSLTRLKFSLRGRALSGHRGGVSCIDVPSNVYRPDSIVTGGADGLIKLWSLRSPGVAASARNSIEANADPLSPRTTKASQSGDALSILSGHGGRILCIKTAWHGDRLLSGGADRTVRVWDLAGSGGKCLNSLSGHLGWVTHVQYWGPNTIISASTDRSIALWDARVRNTPLFMLRHHYAPISDLLVGSRTDPVMLSAASDATVAAWDFRSLSGSEDAVQPTRNKKNRLCTTVRDPSGRLYLHDYSQRRHICGSVLLSRGPSHQRSTVMCVGSDTILREWNYETGEVMNEHVTGHCDLISNLESMQGDKVFDSTLENNDPITGTITTSWDGTVRVRTLLDRGTVQ
jgi:hypothetical protein